MALELIGQRFQANVLDLHTGGVDLIFPHHEDEIAQSCAYTGQPEFARYWMHGEFLNVRGTKMSKRFGNITTARDLRQDGVDAGAIRLLAFQTHYRQKLDLTDEGLAAAREGSRRLGAFALRLGRASLTAGAGSPEFTQAAEQLDRDFSAALDDDLNAPRGIAAVFDFVSAGNRLMDEGKLPGEPALKVWDRIDEVLAATTRTQSLELKLGGTGGENERPSETPPAQEGLQNGWAESWARLRIAAKSRRDFAEADRIRALLGSHGWEVRDRKDGVVEVVRKTGRRVDG
jgi:cysteinyl-tRNA synthetase